MDFAVDFSVLGQSSFICGGKSSVFVPFNRQFRISTKFIPNVRIITMKRINPRFVRNSSRKLNGIKIFDAEVESKYELEEKGSKEKLEWLMVLAKRGFLLAAVVCGVFIVRCGKVIATDGVVNAGYKAFGQEAWPKLLQVLIVLKEQGLVLAALLGLSAFFSMAETSITTLWPWKVRELAEKEPENGVFKMLRSDVTRFLTTILIGTTVVNIGATALVTEAATTIFGEAGVSAATGVMTVAILLLTEITPKSIAVHNATEVVRFVVRPVAWLSLILYPVGRVVTFLSMGMLKLMGLKGRRVPVFEQRVDNIVGLTYAMDLLDYVRKGELLESSTVGDIAHKPAYFVPDSMSVWNLLREFRIRKVHMAVVLNEYGGTIGIVTLEDVVEEIVGEIFDENDSKEEIQKKTGYIVMRAEGIFDVDANTSIDQLSEDLNVKMAEGHQYETVSGFVCEAFGYIPRTGENIEVVLEKADLEDNNEYTEVESERQQPKEKHLIFKLEILAGNARKVSAVRFERINGDEMVLETKEVTRVVPRIMKRKGSSNDESDQSDDDEIPYKVRLSDICDYEDETSFDSLPNSNVTAEHKDDHNNKNDIH
ncbi:putative DUF21 domain-containing protein At3g13070, chloroplastic isoform X2 [Papaver somniferum]|uniref:putative DUF21 domain-containing protein At3g13070, chloroplastic isoform X2 n=1 Tax=Papaver somniferum TaxID=3469 RepID=UPI000E6FD5AB|nr:putative DUF21 domain-containing protein At3g13070, chloroplastic isoform X2 [Papaver somniferum]